MTEILISDDPVGDAAQKLADAARAGGHIALAGGTTPAAAYTAAAARETDWSQAMLWFGDERCVAPDDDRANYRMVETALLKQIPQRRHRPIVRRIRGELGHEEGASEYEQQLRTVFGPGMPRLDLVLLGLGSDGHCASLFPTSPALDAKDQLVIGVPEAGLQPHVPRITLTLPLINAARAVVFLVSGKEKADAVTRAFDGTPSPSTPASLVAPEQGTLTVLLDRDAASSLLCLSPTDRRRIQDAP